MTAATELARLLRWRDGSQVLRSRRLRRDTKGGYMNDGMPEGVLIYNGSTEPCDMINGPCCCGAWHTPEEIVKKLAIEVTCLANELKELRVAGHYVLTMLKDPKSESAETLAIDVMRVSADASNTIHAITQEKEVLKQTVRRWQEEASALKNRVTELENFLSSYNDRNNNDWNK